MCQSTVYLREDNQEQLLLEDVGFVQPEEGKILLVNIFGEQKLVEGEVKEIDLIHHKIVLEKR